MAIELVRAPSDTPNITNIDDFVGLRYAYNNVRGYVEGKGNEIGYIVDGANFTITSGRLVVDGVEVDIDANGVVVTVDNTATLTYYTLYVKVNLLSNTATIMSTNSLATYPTIASGDDLTKNTIGEANLVLYTFTAQSGTISNVQKKVSAIGYLRDDILSGAVIAKRANSLKIEKSNEINIAYDYIGTGSVAINYRGATNKITDYAFYDGQQGQITTLKTILTRLDSLGFKSGQIVSGNTSYSSDVTIKKEGKNYTVTGSYGSPVISIDASGPSGWQNMATIGALPSWADNPQSDLVLRYFSSGSTYASCDIRVVVLANTNIIRAQVYVVNRPDVIHAPARVPSVSKIEMNHFYGVGNLNIII